jgi:LmbE family N-acetylglucosaminyl deacetylase
MLAFGHPDDESHLAGSTIAKYSAEGAEVVVVIATRGEAGEIAPGVEATPENLGEIREAELRASVAVAGASLELLDYRDSGMDGTPENEDPRAFVQAPEDEVVGTLVSLMWKHRPHVVVTFDENGGYGHPDHKFISKTTTGAFLASGDAIYTDPGDLAPWTPSKLYYMGFPRNRIKRFIEEYVKIKPDNDFRDIDPDKMGIPDERFTTRLNVGPYVAVRREAALMHRSQGSPFDLFPEAMHEEVFGDDYFVLIHPVPVGRTADLESDLFARLDGLD